MGVLSPLAGAAVTPSFLLKGWVHSFKAVSALWIEVDDQPLDLAALQAEIYTPEACQMPIGILHFACDRNSGFQLPIDLASFSPGRHTIKIVAIDGLGWPTILTFDVTLESAQPQDPQPDIRVVQYSNSQLLPTGGTYDFGSWNPVDLPRTGIFLVCNDGDAALEISGVGSTFTGTGFHRGCGPLDSIAPGTCSQLQLRFAVTADGNYVGDATIQSNDPDEPAYGFSLLGSRCENCLTPRLDDRH